MNGGNYLTISTRNIILNEHLLVYITTFRAYIKHLTKGNRSTI
jgi:hypothetical protein